MYITKSSIRCLERQGKATQSKLAQSGHFPKKNWLLQVRFKPTTLVMLLPTELPRQLSWLGKNHTYTSTRDHHIGVSCTTHLSTSQCTCICINITGKLVHCLCCYCQSGFQEAHWEATRGPHLPRLHQINIT